MRWLPAFLAAVIAAPAVAKPTPAPGRVQVLAFAQGGCNPQAVKRTARKLANAFSICAQNEAGKHTMTFSPDKRGKAQHINGRGSFPPPVARCIEQRVENADWPKGGHCDIEITASAK